MQCSTARKLLEMEEARSSKVIETLDGESEVNSEFDVDSESGDTSVLLMAVTLRFVHLVF